MKKLILILILLFLNSCVTQFNSPMSGVEYKGSINEEGIGVVAKPPFWDTACKFWKKLKSDKKKKRRK